MLETIISKVKNLRRDKTPEEIEDLLLKGKLSEIEICLGGYQYIENFLVSHLVVDIHNPGFLKWMRKRPWEYVVHHIDGDILNNTYTNLQVMTRSDHISLHRTSPKFARSKKARNRKNSESLIAYNSNPENAEAIKTGIKNYSKWYNDPKNVEAINAKNRKDSEVQRKMNGWVVPENSPEFFKMPFTVGDYAKVSGIHPQRAWERLVSLIRSKEIICKKKLINRKWCNVYRNVQ